MLNYSPESEGRGERVLLIQIQTNQYAGDYGHIVARVLRTAIPKGVNPDTGRDNYNDGPDAKGYRNCSWSSEKPNALMVDDLLVYSQLDIRNDEKPYAVGARFHDVHQIDSAGVAKHYFNTLSKIDAKMTKLDNQFGYCGGDLAVYITRLASILGIKKFVTYRKKAETFNLDVDAFLTHQAKDVAYIVNELITQLRTK